MLSIELPDELVAALGAEKAQSLAREALLVKLYDLGEISSGRGAEILGISRRAFLDLLGRYNVSEFDDTMNLEEELRNARSAERIE
jgi:predicted HTH domain antitoxin